jgi:probable O-glycosylation ligase (exosortase A-associated)
MRALIVTLIVFGAVPWMFYYPFVGLMFWVGLGYLNPHRLTFGFARDLPFVQVTAIVTLLAWLCSKEPKKFPLNGVSAFWLLFTLWVSFTTLFALNPHGATVEWFRFIKIQLMTLMMMIMLTDRRRIEITVWVIAGSIAFYGTKGGLFTLLSGGQHHVLGPPGTFIAGSNEIAFAGIITLPLLWYLWHTAERRGVRHGLLVAAALCELAILGSQSRGALLALIAMLGMLWRKSSSKLVTGTLGLLALALGLLFMPPEWMERMKSITEYAQDESALGRINAWWFAFNLANDQPIMGGGLRTFTAELFQQYAPDPNRVHDAHSIFFEVLAEQGYVGLTLFIIMGLLTLAMASRTIRLARTRDDLKWAGTLAGMLQVGLVGYVVGGLFLGLAYFDLPYSLMALIVATNGVVTRELHATRRAETPGVGFEVSGVGDRA